MVQCSLCFTTFVRLDFFVQVSERLIAAIHESSSPQLDMAFFINYNADDIRRQATESTIRYERGTDCHDNFTSKSCSKSFRIN